MEMCQRITIIVTRLNKSGRANNQTCFTGYQIGSHMKGLCLNILKLFLMLFYTF